MFNNLIDETIAQKLAFLGKLFLFLLCLSTVNGGGERDRTDDLLNANQALSQLSYTHTWNSPTTR